jgi:CheY-like chemotaxis protein
LGFEVILAQDGQEGIARAKQEQPDLILMDLVMPVMTGFEATQAIRQIPELAGVIIIAVSASVLEEDQQKSIKIGCDDFLPKPIKVSKLLALLETHLQLEWVYSKETVIKGAEHSRLTEKFVPPPLEELEILYDLSKRGNLRAIRKRAIQLEKRDRKYTSIAVKLQELANAYEDKEIHTLLERFIRN